MRFEVCSICRPFNFGPTQEHQPPDDRGWRMRESHVIHVSTNGVGTSYEARVFNIVIVWELPIIEEKDRS